MDVVGAIDSNAWALSDTWSRTEWSGTWDCIWVLINDVLIGARLIIAAKVPCHRLGRRRGAAWRSRDGSSGWSVI